MSASPATSGQHDHLDEMIASAAARIRSDVPLDHEAHQRLFRRRGEFDEGFVALVTRLSAKQPDYTLARSILGGDFITAEEIMAKRPDIAYSAQQIEALADSIPPVETLNALKAAGYALMPHSPQMLALLAIRALKPKLFSSKTGGWYEQARFAQSDLTGSGWFAHKKTEVTGSTSKTWGEQTLLPSNTERVPNAAETSWFITVFFEVRGVWLFKSLYVRTSSLDADGNHVYVGVDSESVNVSPYWDSYRVSDLGLAAAWQSFLYPEEDPPPRRISPTVPWPNGSIRQASCRSRQRSLQAQGISCYRWLSRPS
ncbi:MAG: hypothetical protein WDN10_01545 [bacterium]